MLLKIISLHQLMHLIMSYHILSVLLVINILTSNGVIAQRTFLDNNLDAYRDLRNVLFEFLRPYNAEDALALNMKRGKIQKQFSNDEPFFCDPNGPGRRSDEVPESVHKLRPGDIDIIGAIGDSLTAGNGALATNILQVIREYKGVSFIGGQGTWRQFLTLTNILKEFNPNLYGYSVQDGIAANRSSKFNVADGGAMSQDIPHMSSLLYKRMKSDPKVDLKKHWKLITLLIGGNDFCSDICYHPEPEIVLTYHERNLTAALRRIRDNIPRTIVNVIGAPSIKLLLDAIGTPNDCITMHVVECSCMFGLQFRPQRKRLLKIMKKWNDVQFDVVNREEFHNRTDFTVNFLPWPENFQIPKNVNNQTDFTYMSMDCFHLSQKAYAWGSNALWNNMMDLEQNTTTWPPEFTVFKCPTKERPYLATRENSLS